MIRTLSQTLTIGRNTFIESIRQPIFSVLTLAGILAIILNPSLAANTLDDDNKIMIDMGLSTLFVVGLLLAAFTATGVLSQEIENKTVLTVVSKPVARPVFVLGKYLGVVAAIALAYWTLSAVFLLASRQGVMQTAAESSDGPVLLFGLTLGAIAVIGSAFVNYFYHWIFTSSLMISLAALQTLALVFIGFINKNWAFQGFNLGDPSLLLGLVQIFMGLMIITALAIVASTRLGQIMTLLICAGAFMLGLISDYMFQDLPRRLPRLTRFWDVLYRVVPNFQMFWPADAITEKNPFPSGYVLWTAAYAVLFVTALLSLAVALFQTREVG